MTWLPLEALDDIPTFLRRRNASWRLQARLLRIAHIVLGVCATAMAVAAGVLVDKENGGRVGQMLAFAAGAASAVLAFFSVESKGNRMRNAERILTAALIDSKSVTKEATI